MKVAVFGSKSYDRQFLSAAGGGLHELVFLEPRLTLQTVRLAEGFPVICVFVNDRVDRPVIEQLAELGVRLIALRCAGFNHVDLKAAAELGIAVVRVPAYSPHAVAEHALGMMLALNRKYHKAYHRVREGNFALEGLLGFDLYGKTAGVVGTGKIGALVANMLAALGCRVQMHDVKVNEECRAAGVYVLLEQMWPACDIITLHCPLLPSTQHLINRDAIAQIKPGVMLINTSRGGLIDTRAVIAGLKSGRIGYLGLDVYEEETDLFFQDLSGDIIQDDLFSRLLTFPNVLITGHQAFFTQNALQAIAAVTVENITAFARGEPLKNEVRPLPDA